MSLLVGDQLVLDAYIGSTPVFKIYKGNILIEDFTYQPSPSPTIGPPNQPTNIVIGVYDIEEPNEPSNLSIVVEDSI